MKEKSALLSLIFILFFAIHAFANNLVVSNVSLYRAAGQPVNTIGVKFDLTWDNSFNAIDDNGNVFFDRAWVFVKYWDTTTNGSVGSSDNAWKHATLISGGTVGDYNSSTGVGISSDKKGAFCKPGANQIVYWNYAGTNGDGLSGTDSFLVQVMAIEMVYIPQGSFYVGSGGTEVGAFYRYPNPASPYKITSEDAITVGTATGDLYYSPGDNYGGGDQSGPIPAEFPKGYKSFYMMKYEVTQNQYVSFLNTLSRAQQAARVVTAISSGTTSVTNRYVMSGTSEVSYRNGIRCNTTIDTALPITFYCDLNGNDTPNESDDGQYIACNFITWADSVAFADWAALRPMTELEFEKACRGPKYPIPNEHAWGTSTMVNPGIAYTLSNAGTASEGIATNYSTTAGNWGHGSGPFRAGIFAANANNTGRVTSGASYYGIMELSGNLVERAIPVGRSVDRAFIGSHGDGDLTTSNSNWSGWGSHGGMFDNASYNSVSNRMYAVNTFVGDYRYGGRYVRTAD